MDRNVDKNENNFRETLTPYYTGQSLGEDTYFQFERLKYGPEMMEHSSSSEGRRQENVSERPHCSLDRFLSNPYRFMSECVHAARELSESYFTKSGRPIKLVGGRPANAKFSGQVMEMSGHLVTWRVMVATLIFSSFLVCMFLRGRLFDASLHPIEIVRGRIMELKVTQLYDGGVQAQRKGILFVEDVVTFPDEVLLLVQSRKGAYLPRKEDYECVFGGTERTTIFTLGFKEPQLVYIRCPHPRNKLLPLNGKHMVTLGFTGSQALIETVAEYPTKPSWETLVYETIVQQESIILFVKGLNTRRSKSFDMASLRCVFGNMQVMTWVRIVAQEVVRCDMPHPSLHESLTGKKISVRLPKLGVMPSVAYFNPPTLEKQTGSQTLTEANQLRTSDIVQLKPKHFVCACTMIWNQARFLKEWIMYHSYLGVERWYLYDNNSDDEIEEVLSEFLAQYNVSRHAWPWRKTQEAGFSRCALGAQADCEWVMFIDVDEFVYPLRYLDAEKPSSLNDQSSILKKLIKTETEKVWGPRGASHVGELRLDCHDFGPSGLAQHPEEGVMAGYTCRMRSPQRHKSFLRVDALNDSLLNVVHHFDLKRTFRTIALHSSVAVINHYKYQVWEVFKAKFYRRVATYMTDWTLNNNENSKDRVPGLGTEPVEPVDWPDRFCQIIDLGLRNFTLQTFQHLHTHQLLWQ